MQKSQVYLLFAMTVSLSILGCSPGKTPVPTQIHPTPVPTPSLAPTPQAPLETVEGTFQNQISLLEENMPRSGSEAYVIPSPEEQAEFSKLVSLIHNQEFAQAISLAAANHFRLHYYVDQGDDSAVSLLLREQRPIQKGWGLYAFRMGSTSNIIVEAPHPLHDRRTPAVAMDIYRALDAHALLIAGAHRYANHDGSADVAHEPDSIFHAVHASLVQEIQSKSGPAIVLQIHGFHTSNHEGYPAAVIGFGKTMQPAQSSLARVLETAFRTQGIQVGLCIGDTWRDLCGRKNEQGALSDGAIFIHLELDEALRKQDDALIAALLQVFGQ